MKSADSISKMCIAEIQMTFGVSKISAMKLKQGISIKVDFKKTAEFLNRANSNLQD